MEGFDLFCVGSIPTFLRFRGLGNERGSVPLCSLYHSDPLHSGTFPQAGGDSCIGDWYANVP